MAITSIGSGSAAVLLSSGGTAQQQITSVVVPRVLAEEVGEEVRGLGGLAPGLVSEAQPFFWTASRTPEMSPADYEAAVAAAVANGYDAARLQRTPQSPQDR